MSERLCGYCRTIGHRKPDCPTFLEHRNTVLTHTPIQRKRLIEALGEVGLGIGAMVKLAPNWYDNKEYIGIVQGFDWVANCNFIDTRNVKYSKQVSLTTKKVDTDYEYRGVHADIIRTGYGTTEETHLMVPISRLLMRKSGILKKPEDHYVNNVNWEITAPSHDIDYDPEVLVRDITMPRRLAIKGETTDSYYGSPHVRGVMPA